MRAWGAAAAVGVQGARGGGGAEERRARRGRRAGAEEWRRCGAGEQEVEENDSPFLRCVVGEVNFCMSNFSPVHDQSPLSRFLFFSSMFMWHVLFFFFVVFIDFSFYATIFLLSIYDFFSSLAFLESHPKIF